jgi:hypothetical protein
VVVSGEAKVSAEVLVEVVVAGLALVVEQEVVPGEGSVVVVAWVAEVV